MAVSNSLDLTSKKTVRALLQKYNLRPLKRFGQNFLISKKTLKKIVKAANLQPKDLILEIGPGLGVLTQELAKEVKKVIAVEKDPKMIEILKETLKDFINIEIIHGDILKIKNQQLKIKNSYKIVANLPFYLTAPVIKKFLENTERQPREMILVVQKEVAQRICARPPKMNLLAVSVQFYSKPEIISYIPKKAFWPQPKVDAAIIKIQNLKSKIKKNEKDLFFKIVKAGFLHPRKIVINNLSKGLKIDKIKTERWLLENDIQPNQRVETLRVKDWLKLTKSFNQK